MGEHLYKITVRQAVEEKSSSRPAKRPFVPDQATVIAISVELESSDFVDEFQDAAVIGMTESAEAETLYLGGHEVYFSRSATKKGLHRVFFFFRDTVLVQVYSRKPATVKSVAAGIAARS